LIRFLAGDGTVGHFRILACAAALWGAWAAGSVRAEIVLPRVFGSRMVLQRDMPVPIWGTGAPGEQVTVTFRGQTKTATADGKGNWRLTLDPLTAGGPDTLMVGTLVLEDVLVGEVWLGSGQSNMAQTVKQQGRDKEMGRLAARGYDHLRMLRQETDAGWERSTPGTNQTFSAHLFAFGCHLQEQLGVPVGLIVGAVGATPSGSWIAQDMLTADADVQALIRQMAPAYDRDAYERAFEAERTQWMAKNAADEEAARTSGAKPPRAGPSPTRPAVAVGELHGGGPMGSLFEKHISPHAGFALRGVLWDQGESSTRIAGVDQATLMPALIKGWRAAWGQDFPFLYVQKPSGGGTAWDLDAPIHAAASRFTPQPAEVPPQFNPNLSWTEFRCRPRNNDIEIWAKHTPTFSYELHHKIMKTPGTFMVTSTDLGEGVHPQLKSAYGRRGADVALGAVYKKGNEIYGPLYAGHDVEGSDVRVRFTHIGQGLAVRHADQLQGFLIAGADKRFHWADAKIDGDTVVVSCPSVTAPAAVRYAWAPRFPWANLFNKDGLPAQPFRTDDW
jgi:sialate O-acetylesterase